MKKFWPTLFIFSLILNIHFYKKIVSIENQIDDQEDQSLSENLVPDIKLDKNKDSIDHIQTSQSSVQKEIINQDNVEDIAEDLNQEFNDISAYEGGAIDISAVMEEFEEAGKKFIDEGLELGPDAYEKYLNVKKTYEKEMLELTEKFSKDSIKLSDKEMFIPSQEHIIEQTKVMERALSGLKSSLGEDNYNKYMKFVHRFNQELVRRSPNGSPTMLISF